MSYPNLPPSRTHLPGFETGALSSGLRVPKPHIGNKETGNGRKLVKVNGCFSNGRLVGWFIEWHLIPFAARNRKLNRGKGTEVEGKMKNETQTTPRPPPTLQW